MKKILFITMISLLVSCSSDGDERVLYDITYSVATTNGATLNKVEYRDNQGDLKELTNVTSPWSITLRIRAGLALEAAAYGDIPHGGSLSITAVWKPDGGSSQNETETLPNDTPNSIITNGRVEISGRTLPD